MLPSVHYEFIMIAKWLRIVSVGEFDPQVVLYQELLNQHDPARFDVLVPALRGFEKIDTNP